MHNERDMYSSYRVQVNDTPGCTLTYSVTTYPPGGKTVMEAAKVTVDQQFRADVIPEWLRISIDMLDIAAVNGNALIPFFGSKAGNTYWFMAVQTQERYDDKETKSG